MSETKYDQQEMIHLACLFLEDITCDDFEMGHLNNSQKISLGMSEGDDDKDPERIAEAKAKYAELQAFVSNYGRPVRETQLPTDRDAWSDNKADRTGGAVTELRPDWKTFLEYQAAVAIEIADCDRIYFGGANETFGASVHDDEGEFIAYLETGLDYNALPVEELAAGAVKVVEAWLAAGKPAEGMSL